MLPDPEYAAHGYHHDLAVLGFVNRKGLLGVACAIANVVTKRAGVSLGKDPGLKTARPAPLARTRATTHLKVVSVKLVKIGPGISGSCLSFRLGAPAGVVLAPSCVDGGHTRVRRVGQGHPSAG